MPCVQTFDSYAMISVNDGNQGFCILGVSGVYISYDSKQKGRRFRNKNDYLGEKRCVKKEYHYYFFLKRAIYVKSMMIFTELSTFWLSKNLHTEHFQTYGSLIEIEISQFKLIFLFFNMLSEISQSQTGRNHKSGSAL